MALFLACGCVWLLLWNTIASVESKAVAQENCKNIALLSIAMPRSQVLEIMGKPQKVEAYSLAGRTIEFLFYRIEGFNNYLQDCPKNFVPVAIENKNGLVLALEPVFYEKILILSRQ